MCRHISSRSTHLYFGVVEFFALDCSSHHYTIQHATLATHNSVLHCSTLQCNALYGNAFRSTGAHRVVSACTVLCMLLTFHTWLHASHLAGIPFPSCWPRLPLHCNAQPGAHRAALHSTLHQPALCYACFFTVHTFIHCK
jgi:hypothetical protein